MKIAFFDSHRYDRSAFETANVNFKHDITFLESRLTSLTAGLAAGHEAICIFVNDMADAIALSALSSHGIKLIALRCAGFNNVDLQEAERLGIKVIRVPEYSPHALAEHAFALFMTLNRKIHRANSRVHELNFSLEGLVGFDLYGKTFGVIGTGRIGTACARIAKGFGCRVLAFDPNQNEDLALETGLRYVDLDDLLTHSDVISLHAPLTPQTHHLLDERAFGLMKPGTILINTSRGGLIDTPALIRALKSEHLGGACLDVYEEEENIFFRDLSGMVLQDDVLARLLTFPNVLITSHQAFLTREALSAIATTTLQGVTDFHERKPLQNQVYGPNTK
jgi:D-lactate dehydrogenase